MPAAAHTQASALRRLQVASRCFLRQVVEHDCEDAPFEVDARAHELDG